MPKYNNEYTYNDYDYKFSYTEECQFFNDYIDDNKRKKINNGIIEEYMEMDDEELLEEYVDNPEAVNNILNHMDIDGEKEYNDMVMDIFVAP